MWWSTGSTIPNPCRLRYFPSLILSPGVRRSSSSTLCCYQICSHSPPRLSPLCLNTTTQPGMKNGERPYSRKLVNWLKSKQWVSTKRPLGGVGFLSGVKGQIVHWHELRQLIFKIHLGSLQRPVLCFSHVRYLFIHGYIILRAPQEFLTLICTFGSSSIWHNLLLLNLNRCVIAVFKKENVQG